MRIREDMEPSFDELNEKLKRIDSNYKHYRDGWVFSVSQEEGLVVISARNKTKGLRIGVKGEIEKRLYLGKSDGNAGNIIAQYKYSMSDSIILMFYLFLTRMAFPAGVLISVYALIFSDNVPILGSLLTIGILLFATVGGWNWAKGRRQLERDRYSIIKEVLTKNDIGFQLEDEVKKPKRKEDASK
jgi:hypothetical protein